MCIYVHSDICILYIILARHVTCKDDYWVINNNYVMPLCRQLIKRMQFIHVFRCIIIICTHASELFELAHALVDTPGTPDAELLVPHPLTPNNATIMMI